MTDSFEFGSETQFARARAILRDAIANHAFPGAALAVNSRWSQVLRAGFGHFTYDADSPTVEAHTIFDLASLTKVVATTSMAMLLYERSILHLEAPIHELLPEFVALAPRDQRPDRERVTVRMLLAHSSSLPAYVRLFETARTRDELLHGAYATPLVATPGSKADYSDIGFILLGEILERLAHESLDAFCQREVFSKIAMPRTMFKPPLTLKDAIPPTEDDRTFRHRIIQGEVNDENAYVMGGVAGHAGLFSSAHDVARFADFMLHRHPLFRPETIELFTRRETSPEGTSRALGWDTPSEPSTSGQYFSPHSFGHLGFTGTSLWIDPERQLSVTMLTNRIWPNRSSRAIRQVWPLLHDAVVEAL
jgi:serine-type D-Ala-D-Ala carboxypeptidase